MNDNEKLVKIIREFTKTEEHKDVISEQVLVLAKRVELQRVQSAIINNLSETEGFDKMKIVRCEQRQTGRKLHTHIKTPAKQNCSYFGSSHLPRQCLAYSKKYTDSGKISHIREVCRSTRGRVVHNVEQEPEKDQEDQIDMVNIISISFNNICSVITSNLKHCQINLELFYYIK